MNKGGSVPFALLFFLALLLVVSSLLAFRSSSGEIIKIPREFSNLQEKVYSNYNAVLMESVIIAEQTVEAGKGDLKSGYKEISSIHESYYEDLSGNFFGRIRNGDFVFEKRGEGHYFEVNDVFIEGSEGASRIRRYFSIAFELNNEGIRFINK